MAWARAQQQLPMHAHRLGRSSSGLCHAAAARMQKHAGDSSLRAGSGRKQGGPHNQTRELLLSHGERQAGKLRLQALHAGWSVALEALQAGWPAAGGHLKSKARHTRAGASREEPGGMRKARLEQKHPKKSPEAETSHPKRSPGAKARHVQSSTPRKTQRQGPRHVKAAPQGKPRGKDQGTSKQEAPTGREQRKVSMGTAGEGLLFHRNEQAFEHKPLRWHTAPTRLALSPCIPCLPASQGSNSPVFGEHGGAFGCDERFRYAPNQRQDQEAQDGQQGPSRGHSILCKHELAKALTASASAAFLCTSLGWSAGALQRTQHPVQARARASLNGICICSISMYQPLPTCTIYSASSCS